MVIRGYRWLFLILFLLFSAELSFAATPKILKIKDVKPGTQAVGFSTFEGIEPESFDVELGEPVNTFNLNLVLARLSGGSVGTSLRTPLEKIGPVAGMSGSPIFINCQKDIDDCTANGTLVGALSYGIGSFIEGGMNFMLTPAEYMLGVRSGGYMASYLVNHLPPKISFRGLEYYNLMLFPKMNGLAGEVGVSAKCPDSAGKVLKPGSMISVYLAWGEITVPASGTVTWVDDNSVYAFGHPLFGVGMVKYPFSHVKVSATIQTPLQPYKIAGCYLDTQGLIVVDGAYEIAGILGVSTPLVPYGVDIHINDQTLSFREEIAISPITRQLMNGLPYLWAQGLLGNLNKLSLAYWARIVVKDEPEIFLKNIIPLQVEAKENKNSFARLFDNLDTAIFKSLDSSGLIDNIEKVQIHIDLVSNLDIWKAKTSFLSQSSASPGETVYINLVLEKVSTGATKQISIPVKVPDDFMSRLGSGDPGTITVLIQSSSKFTDKRNIVVNKSSSVWGAISEVSKIMNRQNDVLYIQQLMVKSKNDQESDKVLAKSTAKTPLQWGDLSDSDVRQLPAKDNLEVVFSATPPLGHFIDFDATFSIKVQTKDKQASSDPDKTKKKRHFWFLWIK